MNRQDTTGYFGRRDDVHLKWHGIIDKLEAFFKDRIQGFRRKVDHIVPAGLKHADHIMLHDVINHESQLVDESIRSYININQEKLVEELNAKVAYKDSEIQRLETSLHE
jgi:hypothetical protein